MTLDEAVDHVKAKLRDVEEAETLLGDEFMAGWLERQEKDAEKLAIRAIERPTSNYAKAQASGILRYWRRKLGELHQLVAPETKKKLLDRLDKLTKQQEEFYAGSGTDDGKSTRYSVPYPFGEF
jgi:hypothetical protein